MALPPFAGATRRLVLINLAAFFGFALFGWAVPRPTEFLLGHLLLVPVAVVRGEVWQLVTYAFAFPLMGILGTLFAMLSLWFTGSYLEDIFGSRWVMEMYFFSSVAGGLLASAITFTHVFDLRPDLATFGTWPPVFALLVAFAAVAGDQVIRLYFVISIKAKYFVAIFILISLAVLLKGGDRFGALTQLSAGLMGYLFVKFAPRRGLAFGFSERYFGLRNDYYRWKRRRAAQKFKVYMGKQGREVHFDKDGKYVDPDERRDPNDKRWMN
jgi:membrane associated rhomboid family serine protease